MAEGGTPNSAKLMKPRVSGTLQSVRLDSDQGTLQRSARLATNYLDQFTRGKAADNVVVSANSLTIADVPNNGTVLGLLVRIISRQIVTHYFKSPLVTT
jgi:hypothetical protein